jgi:hypothetical protein
MIRHASGGKPFDHFLQISHSVQTAAAKTDQGTPARDKADVPCFFAYGHWRRSCGTIIIVVSFPEIESPGILA